MSAVRATNLVALSPNPLSVICAFADDQTLARLSGTCHAMNLAVEAQFPNRWRSYLALHTPAPTRPIEELRGELGTLHKATHDAISEIQKLPAGNRWHLIEWRSQFYTVIRPELITCAGMVSGVYSHREKEDCANEGFVVRYHAFLTRTNVDIEEIQKLLQNTDDPHFYEEGTRCYPQLVKSLKTFAVQESTALRFEDVVQKVKIPSDVRRMINTFQSRDATGIQERAKQGRDAFDEFIERNKSATVSSILGAEERLIFSDMERDRHLRIFWSRVPGLENFAHAYDIRSYLDNPDNAAAIGAITSLGFHGLEVLPPEIGKFPNLRELTIHGTDRRRLTALPETLTNLNGLETLILENNDFPEFPEQLLRIPNLTSYSLRVNQTPITILPEEAASDRFLGGICSLVWDALAAHEKIFGSILSCFDGIEPRYQRADHCYGNLPREQFTEIPFNLWFRENFSIPHLPVIAVAAIVAVVLGVGGSVAECLLACIPFLRDPGCVGTILMVILLAPFFIVGVVSGLALNLSAIILDLPIFLLNVLINRVIGPWIVFPIRDCLGYDPMVEVNQD